MRPTLKDVAALAGVSVQTVSNVINSRVAEMRPETRARVEDAMRTLNYYPNSQARGLRSQKTNTLAFLLLDPDPRYLADPMTDLIIAGVGAVVRERGYMLLVHAAQPDSLDQGLFMPIHQNRVDGALLLLSGKKALRQRYVDEMKKATPNFVVFEDVEDTDVLCVTADNHDGSYAMTTRLIETGHSRIAFIGTAVSWPMIDERYDGYRAALQDARIAFDPALTRFEGNWDAASGGRSTAQLCDEADPPTAMIAGNDLLAIGAIKVLKERGISVPDDFAVAGFDDFAFAEHTDPPLTTVRVPGFDLGHLAATLLIDRIEGATPESGRLLRLPVELMIRGSA
ncbi:MAG: LacI family DNA-binding transcriptional regulator [Mycobacterium sp.]